MIRTAIEKILGIPMDDPTFAQASLSPRLSSLGLRKVVEHADLAYHASWHEAQKVAKEKWAPLPSISPSKMLLLSGVVHSQTLTHHKTSYLLSSNWYK